MRIVFLGLLAMTVAACSSGSQNTKPVGTIPQPDIDAIRAEFVAQCDANPPTDAEGLRICECARTNGANCPAYEFPIVYPR